jgi:undecaprenyl-diphosphatase
MDGFDAAIIGFFNQFSRKSETFDLTLRMLADSDLFKGGVVVAMLAALWVLPWGKGDAGERRRSVLASFAGTFASLLVARGLALVTPFRDRPKFDAALRFVPPYSITEDYLKGWSSFPSDHATMFVALATGIFLVSRPLGLFAFAYVLAVILFPRIYLGLHYPTDILAGALLGWAFVLLANRLSKREEVGKAFIDPVMEWSRKYPVRFYCVFVWGCYETSRLFAHVRRYGKHAFQYAQTLADGLF